MGKVGKRERKILNMLFIKMGNHIASNAAMKLYHSS